MNWLLRQSAKTRILYYKYIKIYFIWKTSKTGIHLTGFNIFVHKRRNNFKVKEMFSRVLEIRRNLAVTAESSNNRVLTAWKVVSFHTGY